MALVFIALRPQRKAVRWRRPVQGRPVFRRGPASQGRSASVVRVVNQQRDSGRHRPFGAGGQGQSARLSLCEELHHDGLHRGGQAGFRATHMKQRGSYQKASSREEKSRLCWTRVLRAHGLSPQIRDYALEPARKGGRGPRAPATQADLSARQKRSLMRAHLPTRPARTPRDG